MQRVAVSLMLRREWRHWGLQLFNIKINTGKYNNNVIRLDIISKFYLACGLFINS